MHCCKVNSRFLSRLAPLIKRCQGSLSAAVTSEGEVAPRSSPTVNLPTVKDDNSNSDTEYPPILDVSRAGKKRREREEWHNKIKKLGTVEEKIFELNMPRYYGWKSYKIDEGSIPYDALRQAQYITRTAVIDEKGLPAYYDDILSPETVNELVEQIKGQVEEALLLEYNERKWDYHYTKDQLEDKTFMDNLLAKAVSIQMNRILTVNLSSNYNHLMETQLDIEPRNEAFWMFGGLESPYEVVRMKTGHKFMKEFKDEPINQTFQYYGSPVLQLRHQFPLKEILPLAECMKDKTPEIPVEPYDLRKTGYFLEYKRATIVPGFWPGDINEFGVISYHNRGYLTERPKEFNDDLDAIKTQAVFGSFGWLYPQACYQGFSTFQDPTYPFVNQMIITNGQWWSFAVYQLNTTTMHVDAINENQRANICWISEPIKLFDSIEDGKVQGLNDDVLRHLIKFYANVPEAKEGVEMKPYLSKEKLIAGIKDPKRRIWLEEKYKHLISNRSRHRLMPEIYHWQQIYMINHKTRPLEKKRDPWQFGIKPVNRRLDDHTPEYIPKALREHPKSRKKWAKTYYPEVREEEENS